jgi:hypothetical protein
MKEQLEEIYLPQKPEQEQDVGHKPEEGRLQIRDAAIIQRLT